MYLLRIVLLAYLSIKINKMKMQQERSDPVVIKINPSKSMIYGHTCAFNLLNFTVYRWLKLKKNNTGILLPFKMHMQPSILSYGYGTLSTGSLLVTFRQQFVLLCYLIIMPQRYKLACHGAAIQYPIYRAHGTMVPNLLAVFW